MDFTISFDDSRLAAVQAIVDEWNSKGENSGDQLDIPSYLQRRANQLADAAVYQYKIPPTRDEYVALQRENAQLKDQLANMTLATSGGVRTLG